ncbi:hydroxyacylglutathione hydrolase [Muribacter muris]|uniref:Hydroxyacylglutathione hydrolase n=1 Tax=Muribacter muris TaxID=67855 RepID=A0A4Y9K201_9PAST|nr:hydroxyacylglutathione hydrolase [Muribacter muris]MBF0784511.1 hydroxyacylglutathione hydrolase [Muribacter muris]MBF0826193.1 hydroxyacylglutathione hydrolase [Muribacter muris]TFV12094.1 hydroxyacylglutathione hydrolase [Muribacter muris]
MISIFPIPALADNYIWVLAKGQKAVIVDPGESQPVSDFLAKYQLEPTACLLTHNHNDHTGGVLALRKNYPQLKVFGPQEVAAFATEIVYPTQQFSLLDLPIEIIESGGHTEGHLSYLVDHRYLFCGDALFCGGCGRVFTQDYVAQFAALQRFAALADEVAVYPAHEYTQSNLKFAEAVLPPSCVLMEYQERADMLRAQNRPTLPTTIGVEKQINPFLKAQTLAEFTRLRKQKDNF